MMARTFDAVVGTQTEVYFYVRAKQVSNLQCAAFRTLGASARWAQTALQDSLVALPCRRQSFPSSNV